MAFPDDVFPADDHCEICGAKLGNEVVIQEFADGSFARLCSECYAGAKFSNEGDTARGTFMNDSPAPDAAWPDASGGDSGSGYPGAEAAIELDPLEMTKELLTPVSDLINLQGEMQEALERLAGSLERFASGVVTDSLDRTAIMEDRVRSLESELDRTRNRLREAESLLVGAGGAAAAQTTLSDTGAATAPTVQGPEPAMVEGPPPVFAPTPTALPSAADEPLRRSARDETDIDHTQETDMAGYWTTVGAASPSAPAETTPSTPTSPEVFSLEEVQWAQRYFNDSPFTARMRDVRRSLGKPRANLSRVAGADPRVLVTICWDIVWYQYLVELRKEGFSGDRVSLFREGMELDELSEWFKDKNASMDDDGRLDASELEVRLLSDPTVLITEMPPEAERAMEDATEEIWDQHVAPEFKWDD